MFVRHGESEYSAKMLVNGDPSVAVALTEEGREQAEQLRDLNDPFYGAFEGKALADYRKWAGTHGPLDVPPGDGETRAVIAQRYARGFRWLLGRPEETVLVVCHSLPIAFALAAADGRRPSARMPLVTPAEPHVLYEPSLREAVERIEDWVRDPVYP